MSNPVNGGQNYYWNAESVTSTVSQNMGYYSAPAPSFPPPDFSQPPPNYRLPPPSFPENKIANSYPQYPPVNSVPSYPNGTVSSYQSFTQMDVQCSQNYIVPQVPLPVQENCNYTYWSSNSTNSQTLNQTELNWSQSVNQTTWSAPPATNGVYPASDLSRNEEKRPIQQNRQEFSKSRTDWKSEKVKVSTSQENSRRRSISPDARSRSSKSSRSRYGERRDDRRDDRRDERREDRRDERREDRRDERRDDRREERREGRRDERRERSSTYDRRRRSRERSYDRRSDRNSERFYRANGSYSSRCSVSNFEKGSESKRKRRSKSHESPSSKQSSPPKSLAKKCLSERELLLEKYRRNYCATSKDIEKKMGELSAIGTEGIIENERKIWTRTAPADLYYSRDDNNPKIMRATSKLNELCDIFKKLFIERAAAARAMQPPYEPPPRKTRARLCKHKSEACSSSSSDSDSSMEEDDRTMEELMAKKSHPQRLHPEMWFNDPGEMNDGPLCRCSEKSRRSGIRHGIYSGESAINKCDLDTNNADKLYHYRITISPPTNFLTKTPTIIKHDEHEFIFEGFSMLSHFPLVKLPTCKVIRFNIEYTILYIDEKLPENFTVRELDYFHEYLFKEVLELMDFDLHPAQNKTGCGLFHFMPRFVRDLADNGQEILSMNEVLNYLIKSSKLLIEEKDLQQTTEMPQYKWQNFADEVKGMVVTYPGKKPCSVRVDQLDRNQTEQPPGVVIFPEIVHFGIRPPQLSYAGNADYQKAWRDYVKFRHLLANMPKPSFEVKRKLEAKENKLQELRTQSKMKRDVTVDVSSEGFYRTGIMCDIVQHAMLIPVLVCHLRFHKSLDDLEKVLNYKFKNRYLLQLALTHPSYRENFGTNPDHARNSLTNCGIRQPEYGDRRIHYMNTRKRGINTLINIMSRFGANKETESSIAHNERLEFLGDAVVEFLTSIHLFHMFPDLEEGGLATYRAAIVQNQHLAVLAKKLNLDQFMLYAHGSDLCHDLELRHAMANCFEALMGSLFLDGGIEVADRIFGETLFKAEKESGETEDEETLTHIWVHYPKHPLQEQEPLGDRQWIDRFELLQKLTKFEESIGVEFSHIRLLARAFTDRSIGFTNLTLGSNQRLEFLGDTVLQLIVSEYLYKYFPEHHEGHLSLLRSSLVNNKTQAVVCDDLGMTQYALYGNPKAELKTKDRADLLEAFLGSLYVDKGLDYCQVFCDVCFFPRLQDFIMNQDWNDPKSKLQQCCLTLRTMDGGEPDIPVYKVIECKGPTNTRVYTVAVYFKGRRLAKASGHSIQEAEMNSAKKALESSEELFPQLDHQKRVIAKSMKLQQWSRCKSHSVKSIKQSERSDDSDSSQYRKRRSRSRENRSERRSRNRYDSSDRRIRRPGDSGRRRSPENPRKSPGKSRKSPEILRKNAEDSRKNPEESRKDPEILRRTPEVSRKTPEVSRNNLEVSGESPETSIKRSEILRQDSEVSRKDSDSLRMSPEVSRKYLDDIEKSAEALRKYPENLQKSLEVLRKCGENSKKNLGISERNLKSDRSAFDSSPDEKQSKTWNRYRSESSDDSSGGKRKKRKFSKFIKRRRDSEDASSQDECNVPEQYRISNFSKPSEKRTKS